jgi:hypothetical protein
MNRLLVIVLVVWTLLFGAILVQLAQINESLAYLSSPVRALAALSRAANVDGATSETEAERQARIRRDVQRMSRDIEYATGATASPPAKQSAPTRESSAPKDRR